MKEKDVFSFSKWIEYEQSSFYYKKAVNIKMLTEANS